MYILGILYKIVKHNHVQVHKPKVAGSSANLGCHVNSFLLRLCGEGLRLCGEGLRLCGEGLRLCGERSDT